MDILRDSIQGVSEWYGVRKACLWPKDDASIESVAARAIGTEMLKNF